MKSKVTSAPASEPVTLSELKLSLRISHTAEDTLLTQYIIDARQIAERYTSRKFIQQTLLGYANADMVENSDSWWSGYRVGPSSLLAGRPNFLELDHGPVASITSVYYIDQDNTETLYASTNYYLDNYDQDRIPRIRFNANATAPNGLRAQDCWKVTYVAGYGSSGSDVPADIRRAIIMLAGHLWANRGACGGDEDCAKACGAASMLYKYRLSSALS